MGKSIKRRLLEVRLAALGYQIHKEEISVGFSKRSYWVVTPYDVGPMKLQPGMAWCPNLDSVKSIVEKAETRVNKHG